MRISTARLPTHVLPWTEDRLTDTRNWKLYLPATSLAGDNKSIFWIFRIEELLNNSSHLLNEIIYTKSTEWPAQISQDGLLLFNFTHSLDAVLNKYEVRCFNSSVDGVNNLKDDMNERIYLRCMLVLQMVDLHGGYLKLEPKKHSIGVVSKLLFFINRQIEACQTLRLDRTSMLFEFDFKKWSIKSNSLELGSIHKYRKSKWAFLSAVHFMALTLHMNRTMELY